MPAADYYRHLPAGQTPRKVRDFLRNNVLGCFSRDDITEWFGADITDELQSKGLIKPAREKHYSRKTDMDVDCGKLIPGYFHIAELGRRFASKSLIRPITRPEADRLIADMLKRAHAINADDALMYRIARISIFGSYLTDASDLGDIDLFVELSQRREPYGGDFDAWHDAELARATMLRPYADYHDRQYYVCRREVMQRLKARNRYLSILTLLPKNSRGVDTPTRVIFSERNFAKKEIA